MIVEAVYNQFVCINIYSCCLNSEAARLVHGTIRTDADSGRMIHGGAAATGNARWSDVNRPGNARYN